MKKLLVITLLMTASSFAEEVISINQFSGLNPDSSALTLENGQTQDSKNVVTDDTRGIQGRKGFVRYSTEPASVNLWEFPLSNGTRYLITISGGNLKATTDGTFSILISTVPTDRVVAATAFGDKFYFTDTLNGIKYWDGSSVTTSSRTLTFDKLVTYKGRLAGNGKSGSERVIYLSKYLDGTNWTLVTNPTEDDPTQITVSGSLDENIQALYSTFQDKLIYFKKNSFGALSGSRRSNFALRVYSDAIGVSSVETIRDCDGRLRWLGNNRKIYQFDGAQFGVISEDIDNIMANVSQGDSNTRTHAETNQADWQAGTQLPLGFADATLYVGDLKAGATDVGFDVSNSASTGTFTGTNYVDTTTISGMMKTVWPDTFDVMRDGTSGTMNVWKFSPGVAGAMSVSGGSITLTGCTDGYCGMSAVPIVTNLNYGTSIYWNIDTNTNAATFGMGITDNQNGIACTIDPAANQLCYTSNGTGSIYQTVNGSISTLAGSVGTRKGLILLYISTGHYSISQNGSIFAEGTQSFSDSINPFSAHADIDGVFGSGSQKIIMGDYGISPQTFTYTANYDTKISSPNWGVFVDSHSGTSLTFTAQTSTDNANFGSATTLSSGSIPSLSRERYLKINSIFSHQVITNPAIELDRFDQGAYSSGTFTSQIIDTGISITTYSAISITDSKTSGSAITYQFQTSTNSSVALFLSTGWVNIQSGQIPTNPVRRYSAFRASFTVTESTHIAVLSNFTLNWIEGSNIRASSGYIDSRYWLGLAISSSSNNRILVDDKLNQWQLYDGYVPEAMGLYNSRLYVGNSNGVFLSESGYSDNGVSITAYYTTKTLAPSGYDFYSKFNYLYLTADNSENSLSPTFQIDENGTDNSFGSTTMDLTDGIQNLKYPFSMASVQQGKFINMKWTSVGSSFWRILTGNLYFDKDVVPN